MIDRAMTDSIASPPSSTDAAPAAESSTPYRVLARKYRPQAFDDLIGQEALVRTLSNAIESRRFPHAMILTGVRGVGKTTTARIIAKAINYAGPDGEAGPTVGPTDDCPICRAIAEDRHPDVIEMDAASRTGVNDIRELIESVRYRPTEARYKVYIVDEVHMLSTSAFNALLKTLEEPPEHVIFLFATTEIRKVPVTVLSRCMRFDLRRVEQAVLAAHFARICENEAVTAEPAALEMIARAADGSVRDGLSLLDQAIALAEGHVAVEPVKQMLGLADRARIHDLFEAVMRGAVAEALAQLGELYAVGADPVVVLQDLLELTHAVARARVVPESADAGLSEMERVSTRALAEKLSTPAVARAWQLLLKGIGEARVSPSPLQAAEMVLIRLAHASELPTPGDLVRRLTEGAGGQAQAPAPNPTPSPASGPVASAPPGPRQSGGALAMPQPSPEPVPDPEQAGGLERVPEPELAGDRSPAPEVEPVAPVNPTSFQAVVGLFKEKREMRLARHLSEDAHLVRFEAGHLEFRPREGAPRDLAGQAGRLLSEWTGQRWIVSVSEEEGEATLAERERERLSGVLSEVKRDPLVQAALEAFPGASIAKVREGFAKGNEDS
jgi:DNA polymerase-3 subunit gamma/tau